jgi:AcrR family transcriptional regulator
MRLAAPFRRQHLITTALELFASQGYEGTTTREIAERCGVTEAIIFRHFPTKESLYWAVIEEQCNIRGSGPRLRRMLAADVDELTRFTRIAEDILRRNSEDSKFFRLLLFSALENHELSDHFFQTRVSERFATLADYIRNGIRKGIFRDVDPLLAARGFFGMVVYHFLIQDIFGGKKAHNFDVEEVSRSLAEIWLAGMLRDDRAASANGSNSGASIKWKAELRPLETEEVPSPAKPFLGSSIRIKSRLKPRKKMASPQRSAPDKK